MPNIKKNPSYRNNSGYNGHDMSQSVTFSSSSGMLLPVYYDLLYPGDKVDIRNIIKSRMEVKSPAYVDIEEHVDWFFVPLEQIYSAFGSYIYKVKDLHSSLMSNDSIQDLFPSVPAAQFEQYVLFTNDNAAQRALSYRLLEHLSMAPMAYYLDNLNTSKTMPNIQPMFAAAYQKIYFDKFRLTDYENNYAPAYNLDSGYNTGVYNGQQQVKELFRLRYAPRQKDFFTITTPSPLFGQASYNAFQSNDYALVNQWLSSAASQDIAVTDNQDEATGASYDNATSVGINNGLVYDNNKFSINSASIRSMFAVEKLLEVTRRAGKHYDKQTLAHFGIEVPQGLNSECFYLGGTESRIQLGDVISTAGTEVDALGKIGGKGYGYNDDRVCKFEAKCHGILMAIYHNKPTLRYLPMQLDRLHSYIHSYDWFIEEYDKLGMQPLFGYQAQALPDSVSNNAITSWSYRYQESKLKYDRALGNFAHSLSYWNVAQLPYNLVKGSDLSAFKVYKNSLLATPYDYNDIIEFKYTESSQSLAQPTTLGISVVDGKIANIQNAVSAAENEVSKIFNSDPIFTEFYADVKKASKMSTYGLPTL